jgi:predicted SAM-dependent methyltransferase
MKKLKNYIDRPKSVLTGKDNLGHLYTLKNFPVFMGCTLQGEDDDIVADMSWMICPETGIIQLQKLIPLEILYQGQHNEGIGKVWEEHYEAFTEFLKEYSPKYVLEIGGAHGLIAKGYLSKVSEADWTIIEPNPSVKDSRIKVIKGWFNKEFSYKGKVDTIVHSHVLEHTYDPKEFLESIGEFLKPGDMQIFSFPNMIEQLTRKYTNCLNFEHTAFISEYFADTLLKSTGFEIVGKRYFKDHSIFYAAKKITTSQDLKIENKYEEYKKLFENFTKYHRNMVDELNVNISNTKLPTYLFGAHIFSQYLFGFGMQKEGIIGVLDNGPAKQGKRLYGTSFTVESPKILKDKGPVNIILKAGVYNEEIKRDILENINSEAIFW